MPRAGSNIKYFPATSARETTKANVSLKFISVGWDRSRTAVPALVDARFESWSLGPESLSTTPLKEERCKTQGPPFVSSSFRAHSWAYLVWARPGLLSSTPRGIAWKRSLCFDPFSLPTSTKVSQWRSFRSSSILERRIDRLSTPEAARADTRGKRRAQRENVSMAAKGWGLLRRVCLRRRLDKREGDGGVMYVCITDRKS